jgi:hypothetical protein
MPERRYHKGDVVRFRAGARFIEGVVVEERGPIGIGGRRLYGVEFRHESESEESAYIELPAVDMQPVEPAANK